MFWMPSTTVPGAESIPSRLGRLHSSHQLLLTRQSLFLAGACFSVFQDSHSCAKPRPKMCGGVPREAGHTVTHRGQKAEHSCVTPPARRSSFLPEPLPRKILVARLWRFRPFKYDRHRFPSFFTLHIATFQVSGFFAYKAFPPTVAICAL